MLSSLLNYLAIDEVTRISSKKMLKIDREQNFYKNSQMLFFKFSAIIFGFVLAVVLNETLHEFDGSVILYIQIVSTVILTASVVSFTHEKIQLVFEIFCILISTLMIKKYKIGQTLVEFKQDEAAMATTGLSDPVIHDQSSRKRKKNPMRYIKLAALGLFMLSTSLKQSFILNSSLVETHTQAYILVNFTLMTTIFLIRYFPYQIFTGLSTLQHSQIAPVANDCDSMDIDAAFLEHKRELRRRLMGNKQMNIGPNQPKLSTAYKIIFLLALHYIFCVISLIIFFFAEKRVVLNLFCFSISLTPLVLISRQPQETIYVSYLYNRTIAVPYLAPVLLNLTLIILFFLNFQNILIVLFESCCFLLILLPIVGLGEWFNLANIYLILIDDQKFPEDKLSFFKFFNLKLRANRNARTHSIKTCEQFEACTISTADLIVQ
jgi:hypothetical protein